MTNSQSTSSPRLLDRWKKHPVIYSVYLFLTVVGIVSALRLGDPKPGESGYVTGLQAFVFFVPLAAASLWMLFAEDVSQNSDSRKILRDSVFAPWVLVALLVSGLLRGNPEINELIDTVNSSLLGLLVLYTWLGLIRAVWSWLSERFTAGTGDSRCR